MFKFQSISKNSYTKYIIRANNDKDQEQKIWLISNQLIFFFTFLVINLSPQKIKKKKKNTKKIHFFFLIWA